MPTRASPFSSSCTNTDVVACCVVVVNDEALTQWDLNEERRVFLDQLKASNITPPPNDVLDKQVLQRLIIERALLVMHALDQPISIGRRDIHAEAVQPAPQFHTKLLGGHLGSSHTNQSELLGQAILKLGETVAG